ncbi:DUF4333 domain-containing protein [Janibacter cremeus]|uniref:DUF4333 domain-containing protein n=1 Tax=Janibacter cremeus TaxID=1285192 RepID=A0A852VMP3_9MICO|nr:hypothetical protein [Janibacter cremeus]
MPTWAWIIGGVAALTLFCICGVGGLVFIGVMNAEDSPTQEQTESTTSGSTTDEPSTPGSSTSEPSATSTTPTAPDSSVPTPPEGTTPNTSSLNQLPKDDVEKHVAKGLSGAGHTRDDISCPEHLVLIKGRTTTCTAPVPGDPGARSDVEVTVDWAVIDDDNRVSFYLSFQQSLN